VSCPHCLQGKGPQHQLDRRLGEAQRSSGCCGEKSLTPSGIKPRCLNHPAHRLISSLSSDEGRGGLDSSRSD
jgi:hypothetical protein